MAARVLFAGLWCWADRAGRLEDRPRRLKAEIFPYDEVDVDALLNELAARGFVLRYEAGGGRYLQVVAFARHQSPHKMERPSTIPAPEQNGASTLQEPGDNGTSTVLRRVGSGEWGLGSGEWVEEPGASTGRPPPRTRSGGRGRRESVAEQLERVLGGQQ